MHLLTRATRLLFELQAQAAAERERVLRNLRGFAGAPSAAGGGGANAYPYPLELPRVGPSELEVVDSRASNEAAVAQRTLEAQPSPSGPSLTLMFEAIGVAVNRSYPQPTADAASEQSELKCALA